jgi:hypothetical protein
MVASPDPARVTRDLIAVHFNSTQIFAVRRSQQRRVPQQPSGRRWLHQIISPAKTSTGFSRDFSSAISGFRSLCGPKQRSSLSHRAQLDLRFGTFHSGRALALRTLASTRLVYTRILYRVFSTGCIFYGVSTGPATLDRCCERNVVAPGEYSKWFFCTPIGLYEGAFRPATARRMPARSALADLSCVNPAAVIKPSIAPLWPCPASTTSAPPARISSAACGIRAR